ncbi:hypothetical protein TSUD_158320 [Trifolium subterraneum]|uniref:Aminotransferase-like plant mobile domain-containing protein n=1 Tax=Trifolium subterraneum TaxID=3900 RepID=A0A2Z6MIK8_TRISU|nr:hypothetical protein TSUD_158320 [Trifolium subterraneum]
MEDNVGRTRQVRASRAHSSARKELAANAPPPKRGRRGRQGPPVRGTHDAEAGGSGGLRSRARPPVLDDDDDFDAGEYLNELADYDEEPQAPQPQPQQQANVEEEGYPGGPRDLSLLKDYHNYRAIPIWDAQANDPMLNKYLRCIASANKVIKFQRPPPGVVLGYGYSIGVGAACEMGITLDDVQCLLHLPIKGKFLNHRKMTRPDAAQMVSSFLGIDEGDALDMFATLNEPHLKHSYVSGLVSHYHTTVERVERENRLVHEIRLYRERCIHAFLLFVVGCTIFSNKSSYYLDVVFLQYFQDLSSVHEWNWGSAALVHLQNSLVYASQAGSSQMAGYMSLLELAENVTNDMPLNAKYAPGQGHKDSRGYRQSLDNIQVSDCVFSPYDNRRHLRPLIDVCWFSGWLSWLYKVSHPKTRPLEAPEEQPRPPKLEVLIEESQERRDPNPLGICRSVRDEVEKALAAGEAEEETPVHGTLRRILNMLNPCLSYKRLSRGRRGGRRG